MCTVSKNNSRNSNIQRLLIITVKFREVEVSYKILSEDDDDEDDDEPGRMYGRLPGPGHRSSSPSPPLVDFSSSACQQSALN